MFDRLKSVGRSLRREIEVYQHLINDDRTPKLAKLLLVLAIGYALLPFDLVPDFIPVVGHLDDVIVVPGLIILALRLVPKEIIEEYRSKVYGSQLALMSSQLDE